MNGYSVSGLMNLNLHKNCTQFMQNMQTMNRNFMLIIWLQDINSTPLVSEYKVFTS